MDPVSKILGTSIVCEICGKQSDLDRSGHYWNPTSNAAIGYKLKCGHYYLDDRKPGTPRFVKSINKTRQHLGPM